MQSLLTGCMISTGHLMFWEMNAILSSQRCIRTAACLGSATIRSSITTAQTIFLKLAAYFIKLETIVKSLGKKISSTIEDLLAIVQLLVRMKSYLDSFGLLLLFISSYKTASEFLEKPSYRLHDIYRALDVLGNECDFILSGQLWPAAPFYI